MPIALAKMKSCSRRISTVTVGLALLAPTGVTEIVTALSGTPFFVAQACPDSTASSSSGRSRAAASAMLSALFCRLRRSEA